MVKTPRGGYDGKGVRVVRAGSEAQDWLDALADGEALLVEELVSFVRELAQQIARRPSGQMVAYPVVETVQRDGVCAEVIAPAPGRLRTVSRASPPTSAGRSPRASGSPGCWRSSCSRPTTSGSS